MSTEPKQAVTPQIPPQITRTYNGSYKYWLTGLFSRGEKNNDIIVDVSPTIILSGVKIEAAAAGLKLASNKLETNLGKLQSELAKIGSDITRIGSIKNIVQFADLYKNSADTLIQELTKQISAQKALSQKIEEITKHISHEMPNLFKEYAKEGSSKETLLEKLSTIKKDEELLKKEVKHLQESERILHLDLLSLQKQVKTTLAGAAGNIQSLGQQLPPTPG